MEEIMPTYDVRTKKFSISRDGQTREFSWEELAKYCRDNCLIPRNIICYSTPEEERQELTRRKNELIAIMTNSK